MENWTNPKSHEVSQSEFRNVSCPQWLEVVRQTDSTAPEVNTQVCDRQRCQFTMADVCSFPDGKFHVKSDSLGPDHFGYSRFHIFVSQNSYSEESYNPCCLCDF